jgi:ribosomal protein S12 methylthiotransferase
MDVIDAIAELPHVNNYLDIPLQHASNTVLDRMKRQITVEETRKLINDIRKKVPKVAIRTTMLVGFPGETEGEFQELCDFVEEMRFDRLGVFRYSHEENTSAHLLEDDVSDEVKVDRSNRLMEIQREISFELNQAKIGNICKVLVDRKEGQYFVGRTEHDSVEVDNEVLIDAEKHFVRIGDFVTCKITDAEEYDLYAEPVE